MCQRLLGLTLAVAFTGLASADEIIVKAAKVYTQTGSPLAPGAVRIKDGKIAEVASEIAASTGVKVIDLGNGVLMPGLIDAHTTMGLDGSNSESTKEVTPNVSVLNAVDWVSLGFRIANAEGTTTIGIVPGSDNVIAGLSSVVKTGGPPSQRVLVRDRALVISACSDPTTGNNSRNRPDSIYNRQPTNRMGVVWILRSEFGRTSENGNGPLHDVLAKRKPVVCVSRLETDILSALRLQQDYPMDLTIAGGEEAYKCKEALAAAKVPVLLGRLTTATGSGSEGSETILNTAGPLHAAGVPFALTGGQLLEQARFAVRAGLPADAALAAITNTPAKLLSVENRIGEIAAGRDADLVALSGEPLELTTTIRWTMTGGALRTEEK